MLLPKQPYKFPFTEVKNGRRSFQEKWITDLNSGFPFLAYSRKEDSVYCKPCFLFAQEGVGKGRHIIGGKLVTEEIGDWKRAKEYFNYHVTVSYHKDCVLQAHNFLQVVSKGSPNILSQLDSKRGETKKK